MQLFSLHCKVTNAGMLEIRLFFALSRIFEG